ncbi:F-box/LRR-repeat protein At3g26922 isoform X2 [Spinacia oleracea]|uniref:F-box/LRR-repeat protein At3g26922 isoform X2 n=1 Tax=Spinacia oleracea TaxID=3562 RepID=A0ABM3QPF3_SPIOL|nr:F-box/LRR-repeat protein At3g26922-like isoform X2 [Spinacia oleracea]
MDERDLISELPKDLKYRIMEQLPMKDAARMSTLSKHWNENWFTLPSLVLNGGVSTILPVTTFTHVTNLRLTALHSWKELSCVVAIIRSCPNVQKLHISVNISETSSDVAENSLMSCNLPDKIFATPLH